MSLIVAVISREGGVVASDGRRFNSTDVNFETGKAIRPATIATDDFDKTFALDGGRIIGVACGLLEFSGQTIAQHLTSIRETCSDGNEFTELIEEISIGMSARLREVDEAEVATKARLVDIIVAGRSKISRGNVTMASMRIKPSDQDIHIQERYCYGGDEEGKLGASRVLSRDYAGNRGTKALTQIAERAIKAGIVVSGAHQYGGGKTCGGGPFLRVMAPAAS